ncbi:uncharacterized protein [Prorops nasuta]|uniref:uncharacterized protein n=1 Tax=Prorops nasuta TaxID=863751 RepID=UPI0034CF64CF
MTKVKRFSDLSQHQKNRRLRKGNILRSERQSSAGILADNIEHKGSPLFEADSNHIFSVNSSPHVEDISVNTPSSSLLYNFLHVDDTVLAINYKGVSSLEHLTLRSKLILWADKHHVQGKTLTSLLKILREEGHHDLPKDGRSLMRTPRTIIVTKRSGGDYFHYGLLQGILDQLYQLDEMIQTDTIFINVNIDGLPLTKSSKSQLWPILVQIVHIQLKIPFIIGAFHGFKKPNAENHFLIPIVDEYKELNTSGFTFNGNRFFVQIRSIICDSPARALVTCTKGHNGYFGCSKCVVEGDYEYRKMLFIEDNCALRTDEDFASRKNPEHHIGISPFENILLPMVTTFPLDYMHLICLGQMKKMLRLWLSGPKNKGTRLSSKETEKLSHHLKSLKPWVPQEFVRTPTSLKDLDRWKATELWIFLLYLSPIVMENYLSIDVFKHFLAFHCAIRILTHYENYKLYNAYAKNLLRYFVQQFPHIYGKEHMIYTVHNLIYISDDSLRFGPLDTFSSFPFENHLHSLKKLLRKYEKPLQQIHRRIIEGNTATQLKCNLKLPQYPSLKKKLMNHTSFNEYNFYECIMFENFTLSSAKRCDRICYLKSNKVFLVRHIGEKNGETVVIGQEFIHYDSFPHYPFNSKDANIYVVTDDLGEPLIVNTNQIASKAILIPWNDKFCVFPLLHTYH